MADDLARDLAALRSDLRVLELQIPMARGRARRHGALPLPWPEDPSTRGESALAEALASLEAGELVAIDCEEFPCVLAVLDHAVIEGSGTPSPKEAAVWPELEALGCEGMLLAGRGSGDRHLVVLDCPGALGGPDVTARSRRRMRGLLRDLRETE